MFKRMILIVGLLSLALLLIGRDSEKKREENKGNSSVRVTGTPGEAEKESAPFNRIFLPIKFPEDLPIYPSAKLTWSVVQSENSGYIVLEVNSPLSQITKYYEENLTKLGWAIEARSNDEKNSSFSAVKNNKASTIGIRFVNESGTLLTITYGPK